MHLAAWIQLSILPPVHPEGLEPTTFRLSSDCTTNCAMSAKNGSVHAFTPRKLSLPTGFEPALLPKCSRRDSNSQHPLFERGDSAIGLRERGDHWGTIPNLHIHNVECYLYTMITVCGANTTDSDMSRHPSFAIKFSENQYLRKSEESNPRRTRVPSGFKPDCQPLSGPFRKFFVTSLPLA
jgi:hypothetical protein